MTGDRGAQTEWLKRVLGVGLAAAEDDEDDAFADLDSLGVQTIDLWRAARRSFDDANATVDARITKLIDALRASDDEELQQIGDMGLNGLTQNVKVPLLAALQEAGTSDIQAVAKARPKVEAAIAAFRAKITTDPKIVALDHNPMRVQVEIVGTFGDALDELEDALSTAR